MAVTGRPVRRDSTPTSWCARPALERPRPGCGHIASSTDSWMPWRAGTSSAGPVDGGARIGGVHTSQQGTHCSPRSSAMTAVHTTGPAYQVVNPATGEVVETFETATDAQVEDALAAAHSAYAAWRDVSIQERAATVKRIGELFKERAGELAAIATLEMGKPLSEAE